MAHEEDRLWRERNWREVGVQRNSGDRTHESYRRGDERRNRDASQSWDVSGGRNRDRGEYSSGSQSQGADQGRSWNDRERSDSNWEQTGWGDLERNRGRGYGWGGEDSRSQSGGEMIQGSGQIGVHDRRQDRDFGGSMRSGNQGAGRLPPYMGSGGYSSGRSGMAYGGERMESQGRRGREQGPPHSGYGYGGQRDWGAGAREDERGFWDKATDEVSSWFGDEDAERRRESDRRHTGLGPRNYARSDTRIHEDVCDRLTEHPMVDASDVDVVVSGREVTLSGTVNSRDERRRAEDIVEAVSGVTHVQNNLRVKRQGESSGTSTLDSGPSAAASTGSASSNPVDMPPKTTTTGAAPGIMRSDPSAPPTKGL